MCDLEEIFVVDCDDYFFVCLDEWMCFFWVFW